MGVDPLLAGPMTRLTTDPFAAVNGCSGLVESLGSVVAGKTIVEPGRVDNLVAANDFQSPHDFDTLVAANRSPAVGVRIVLFPQLVGAASSCPRLHDTGPGPAVTIGGSARLRAVDAKIAAQQRAMQSIECASGNGCRRRTADVAIWITGQAMGSRWIEWLPRRRNDLLGRQARCADDDQDHPAQGDCPMIQTVDQKG